MASSVRYELLLTVLDTEVTKSIVCSTTLCKVVPIWTDVVFVEFFVVWLIEVNEYFIELDIFCLVNNSLAFPIEKFHVDWLDRDIVVSDDLSFETDSLIVE